MMKNKRNNLQRARDREVIARLYLSGVSQSGIIAKLQAETGAKYALTQQQISYDLRKMQKDWEESALELIAKGKAEQLAKIDLLEREAWTAWDRSKADSETRIMKNRLTAGGKDAESTAENGPFEKTLKTEQRHGDIRYWNAVMSCIKKRCELLGLYAPRKFAPTDPEGTEPYDSPEDIEKLAYQILAPAAQYEDENPLPEGES